ncbi:MAG: O-antigen ligase family protein [Okeania sp. SIO3B3]|nr:O-antigen ligase family protein [Okeania sp. SIO3B3]
MKSFYSLIFCLSIIIIDPWGLSRGEIWTQPKVLIVLLITLFNLCILWDEKSALTIPRSWKISAVLWLLFLATGIISTINSRFPTISLFGQDQMGDGLLYWLLIATFTLSNTLLLKQHPEIFQAQIRGLLIGGVILCLSIFPQIINWQIDYTATMGKLLKDNILVSSIFRDHQPIGLYSHRGHATFVLVVIGILILLNQKHGWLSFPTSTAILIPIVTALLLSNTRMAIIIGLISAVYLNGRKYQKLLICLTLVGLLVVGLTTTTRKIPGLSPLKQITSDRIHLWKIASRGIRQRPFLGWGFDGFGIAYPYSKNQSQKHKPNVIRLEDFSYDILGKDGQIKTKLLPTYKAHNLILDTTLSVGILGMLFYTGLWGFYLYLAVQTSVGKIEVLALAYLGFTFTWFECAQFTHLVWWMFSVAGSFQLYRNVSIFGFNSNLDSTKLLE